MYPPLDNRVDCADSAPTFDHFVRKGSNCNWYWL